MFELQEKIQDKIGEIGIVPVIKLKDTEDAAFLAQALIAGGISAAEVTFRAEGADEVIRAMGLAFPEMLVGAGTVLTVRQAELAAKSGARFIVSPGYDEDVVGYCLKNELPVFPGCVTPSEIQKALKAGLNVIKFFPASQFGGLNTMKALAGPFPNIKFMPTGGISLENLGEYSSSRYILACGGSFMVKDSFIESKNWQKITKKCAESINIVKKARG